MSERMPHKELENKITELENEVSLGRNAIKALKQSDESYAYLIENATDIIYKTDLKGYFTFFNPIALGTTGFSEEELFSKLPDYLKFLLHGHPNQETH